jgi:predicted nucleic acid-binding protein
MPTHSSQSLVIDTNIWIYLNTCGLVDAAFRLGSLHVPDLMRTKELLTELSWQDLQDKGARFEELTSDSVKTLAEILDTTRGVSLCDVACFVLAEQMHISLITHDKKLRTVARKRNVLTHNFDALLELMATAGIIDESVHTVAIQTLVEHNMRPQ